MATSRITPACPSVRLAAWLIDSAITAVIVMFLMHRYAGTIDAFEFLLQTNYTQLGALLGVPYLVHTITASVLGATPGMYAMETRLLQDNGETVELSNLMRRPLGLIAIALTGGLASLLPYLNDRRRTVGDWLSGTRVVESSGAGRRVSYSSWRLFRSSLRYLGPVVAVGSIALLLISKDSGPNKAIFLDAVLVAATVALLMATFIAVIKVRLSRVRLTNRGIQRSGWFGWKKAIVDWGDIDFARYRPARLCPYLEVHRHNHRRFRVPIEHDSAQLTVGAFANHGVRIEQ